MTLFPTSFSIHSTKPNLLTIMAPTSQDSGRGLWPNIFRSNALPLQEELARERNHLSQAEAELIQSMYLHGLTCTVIIFTTPFFFKAAQHDESVQVGMELLFAVFVHQVALLVVEQQLMAIRDSKRGSIQVNDNRHLQDASLSQWPIPLPRRLSRYLVVKAIALGLFCAALSLLLWK